jgi:hypothetical protein
LGLISIAYFPWLHYIPSLSDGTMETKVYTSQVDAIHVPFIFVINVLLKLITVPYRYEDLVSARYVEI